MRLRSLWCIGVGMVVACGTNNVDDPIRPSVTPDDSATDPGGARSLGGASSSEGASSSGGDSAGEISLDRSKDVNPAWAGVDGSRLFTCDDPDFFPLRYGEVGDEAEVLGEGGAPSAKSASSEFGEGDLTVLLIFDKSGSMGNLWSGKSRWQAGSDAVLLSLDGILDILTIGALVYPLPEEGIGEGCGVPGIESAQQIDFSSGRIFKEEWIARACDNQPRGNTPLLRALTIADRAVQSAVVRGLADGRFRVILVTDGEPTCGYLPSNDEAIIAFPSKWSEIGVETHVIGLPDSDGASALLDAMALAGGTGKHRAPDLLPGYSAGYTALEEDLHTVFR